MKYNFQKIENKWRKLWDKKKAFAAKDFDKKKKYYALVEFPYPSGDGLHVGHVRSYTAMDVIARKRRMEGYNVLYPMGWDSFGLPTENYAIKTGIAPAVATKKNTENFKRQCKALGFSFDWDREIDTTDPKYYKWTQWIFLQLFKHGLAYKASIPINWCPNCKIGLANEESAGGKCDRCGGPVEKRNKEQWMLKITAYADKLLEGLKTLDFLPEIKKQQENWIGRSEGAEIDFEIIPFRHPERSEGSQDSSASPQNDRFKVRVFTTRPDTIFGATYMVLSPEHPFVSACIKRKTLANTEEIRAYVEAALKQAERDRSENKEKTGIELKGVKAINPATKEEIPIWVADYVMLGYGTGAIMAVPAHDERDFEFVQIVIASETRSSADHYIKNVVEPKNKNDLIGDLEFNQTVDELHQLILQSKRCYAGDGLLRNSGKFSGMDSEKAKWEITEFVGGKRTVQYKLRDWVFSRQRYWGEPIPLIFCGKCGWIPVPEEDLPVKLPKVKDYKPREDGQSPLASVTKWVNVKCPKCNGPAKRETDVMPNWAGSSWYYLAYVMRGISNFQFPISKYEKAFKYWLPVNWYNGGMEHVTLHLLYSRFWNQFLYDIGVVPVKEPYKKRTAHGLILAEGGVKMSKSKGNVVNPDTLIKEFGADALRLYEMFIGPFDQAVAWDPRGIIGTSRFLEKVWKIGVNQTTSLHSQVFKDVVLEKLVNKTIKKVTEDIETMSFNTAVSAMMIFINDCSAMDKVDVEIWRKFLRILAPLAPHIAEELWAKLGNKKSIQEEKWPLYDSKLVEGETFELVIQINGKVRDKVEVAKNLSQSEIEKIALNRDKIKTILVKQQSKKIIFVAGRLINFVI